MKRIIDIISPGTFRFLLAFIVVIYHAVSFLTIGHFAVYVFFVLSGYWIVKMFTEKYSKFRNPVRTYLISRIWRIFPVYLAILGFTLLIYFSFNALYLKQIEHSLVNNEFTSLLISNIFVLFNNVVNHNWLIVPAWSLDVELQFYVFAPILYYLFTKVKPYYLFIFSIISSFLILYFNIGLLITNNILIYLLYFLLGVIVYKQNIRTTYQWATASGTLVIAILGLHYLIPELKTLLFGDYAILGVFKYQEFVNFLLTVAILPFVIYNIKSGKHNKKIDGLLSSMSFSLYLIHWPILTIYSLWAANNSGLTKFFLFLGYVSISVLGSFFISKYFDGLMEKDRRQWLKKRKTTEFTQVITNEN
ncbi:hypothetical protein C7S20_08325 [Christiangramia fulva]|uniref:Acyltransferase 3 domain-containing protein n=1 Tax=Christiangramia fulva TaxID=2126553 RepID=A0A2R3Z4S4_9FLAO|nr:acyltransferase [Christiangramia fulva]AVR45270.1 hypothetical protein C7S20_08325 [Christiangramia fulva]